MFQQTIHLPLKKGDLILIVSPSGSILPEYIERSSKVLEDWGFQVKIGKHARKKHGRYAGSTEERIEDFQWAINHQKAKAILCARGGYGAIQLVDKINLSALKKHPKWLIGFSDITILHSLFNQANIPSIHASMSKHLSESLATNESIFYLKNMLTETTPNYQIATHPLNREGNTTGILTGGNLSILYSLRGTPYELNTKNKILFIEEIAEKPYHIDRMMHNLKLGGVLKNINALIVGQISDTQEDASMMKSIHEIIFDAVKEYKYPLCFNFPAGHTDINYPLIFGKKAQLSINQTQVSLEFKV